MQANYDARSAKSTDTRSDFKDSSVDPERKDTKSDAARDLVEDDRNVDDSTESRPKLVCWLRHLMAELCRIRDSMTPPDSDEPRLVCWSDESSVYLEIALADDSELTADISIAAGRVFMHVSL